MKKASIVLKIACMVCLIAASLLAVMNCRAAYRLGYDETWPAFDAADPIILLFKEFWMFCILLILFVVTLFLKKNRIWVLVGVIGFWPIVICTNSLSHTICGRWPTLILRGLHDRLAHDYTLDDLRHFAAEMEQTGILKSNLGWINHGDISDLPKEQQAAFRKLKIKYSFLNWMEDDRISLYGPSILNNDQAGVVCFEWGGALPGHWGCSISTNGAKNNPTADSSTSTLHLSDDIYLYCGP